MSNFYYKTNFSVYGIIDTLTCKKYMLSSDDPFDIHYISHVDGSLHSPNFNTLSNDNYCVEFVDTGTVDVSKSENE